MISKVLMTADAVGGVWTYAIDLARALRRRGTNVVLAVMGPPPGASQRKEAEGLDLRTGNYRLEWMREPWCDIDRAGEWLLSLERETVPDLVHLNGYSHAALLWRAPKIVVAHSCVISWWQAVHGEPAPLEWDEYRRRVSAGLRAAGHVIAPSHAMLDALSEHYGVIDQASVITNGRDGSLFRPAQKQPFVFTAGRLWDQAKNIAALDRACDGLGWPVYAAGDGGGARHIRMLGRLDSAAMRDWFSRASIYALPARYEPFGLSALEAALCGCALVLGDIPSLRENWDGAAAFVSPDDHDALRATLQKLIASEHMRKTLAEAARRHASSFTVERMCDAYLRVYAAVLSRSQPATALRSSTK